MAIGLAVYAVYRHRFVREPLGKTVKAPPALGAALALEYRRILVPIAPGGPSDDALDIACSLAAERKARIVALSVVEVPLGLGLDTPLPELERAANRELDEAVAIGDSYDLRVIPRLVRARSASREIVQEAERHGSEIIVLGSPRKRLTTRPGAFFGSTVDRVLRRAPCRVLIASAADEAPR
jgi:nucleotide-binding universal stress UspA family protein